MHTFSCISLRQISKTDLHLAITIAHQLAAGILREHLNGRWLIRELPKCCISLQKAVLATEDRVQEVIQGKRIQQKKT